jgi:hypothetical protein
MARDLVDFVYLKFYRTVFANDRSPRGFAELSITRARLFATTSGELLWSESQLRHSSVRWSRVPDGVCRPQPEGDDLGVWRSGVFIDCFRHTRSLLGRTLCAVFLGTFDMSGTSPAAGDRPFPIGAAFHSITKALKRSYLCAPDRSKDVPKSCFGEHCEVSVDEKRYHFAPNRPSGFPFASILPSLGCRFHPECLTLLFPRCVHTDLSQSLPFSQAESDHCRKGTLWVSPRVSKADGTHSQFLCDVYWLILNKLPCPACGQSATCVILVVVSNGILKLEDSIEFTKRFFESTFMWINHRLQ